MLGMCEQASQPIKSTRYPAKDKKRVYEGSTFEVVPRDEGDDDEADVDDYSDGSDDDDNDESD